MSNPFSSQGLGYSAQEAGQLFDKLDVNGDGSITRDQLDARLQSMQGERRTIEVRKVAEYSVPAPPRVISRKLEEPPANSVDLHALAAQEEAAIVEAWRQRDFELFQARMAAEQRAQGARAPDVQRLPQYGHRQAWWQPELQIPQANTGIMITHEFGTPVHHAHNLEVPFYYDDAIRSPHWRHIGPWIAREASTKESLAGYLHHHADYHDAQDLVAARRVDRLPHHYHRDPRTQEHKADVYQRTEALVRREVLGAAEVEAFFKDTEAVMYEPL
jgi:hypothetical protein